MLYLKRCYRIANNLNNFATDDINNNFTMGLIYQATYKSIY